MGLSAFNRMRRLKEQKSKIEESAQPKPLSSLTVKQLKALLDVRGIEYNPQIKKQELLFLLGEGEEDIPKKDKGAE